MSRYSEFFLKSYSSVAQLETFEISHSAFSKTYRIVRNDTRGITARIETGQDVIFDYCPVKIQLANDKDDLDQVVKIQLGDLGEIIPRELDRIAQQNKFNEKPKVVYRTYQSNDLMNIMNGPIRLEIKDFAFNREGCSFDAKAPSLNLNTTGLIYTFDMFPMLRGLL